MAIPNPTLAARLNAEGDAKGRVHILDLDSRMLSRKALLEPETSAALAKAYERLGSMINATKAEGSTKRASKLASTELEVAALRLRWPGATE